MYLVNKDFDLLWTNDSQRNASLFSSGTKCYQVLFNSQNICTYCPSIDVFKNYRENEKIISVSSNQNTFSITKICSVPIVIDGGFCSLNTIKTQSLANVESHEKFLCGENIENDNLKVLMQFSDKLPLSVLFLDAFLEVCYQNEYSKRFFKINNQSAKSIKHFLDFNNQDDFEKLITQLLNTNYSSFVSYVDDIENNKKVPLLCSINKIQTNSDVFVLIGKEISEVDEEKLKKLSKIDIYETILTNLKIGILIQDKLNNIIYQNRIAEKLLQNDKELLNQIIKEKSTAEAKEEINFLYQTQKEPNEYINVSIKEYQNNFTNETLDIIEISNHSKIIELNQKLEQYKSKLEQIAKHISFALFRIGVNYSVETAFGKIYGVVDFEKLKEGQNFIELVHNDDRLKVLNLLNELFHFPNIVRTAEFRLWKMEEEWLWVKGTFENIVDERGKIVYVNCFLLDVNEQKKVEEQLKASQEEMRNLALYFESLREEEKKKLAFEIHDELGHLLTAMKLEMSWILKKRFLREDLLHEKLLKLIEMVETTIRKVRSISSQLRPSILDHFGIVAAIEWQAKEFQKQTAIRCRINLPKQEIRLDESKSIVVFRVFQEILTNIARHANATRVDIYLDVDENNLILTVSDNGKGIKPENISSKRSLGITGMKERANSVNGKLQIQGVSNIGTTVILTIPIN
ncbi:MAG: histidine kinase [Ignavibacteria bacterium]|nr:histidine kinase [Ignavibacteria bacterium]